MSEQVQLRFVAKPDDVGVYSNVAQVTSSPWDFTIDFYSANPAEMTILNAGTPRDEILANTGGKRPSLAAAIGT